MLSRVVAVLAALVLVGCEGGSPAGEPLTLEFQARVHFVDQREINAVAAAHGDAPDPGRAGYAVLVGRGGAFECDVYLKPMSQLGETAQQLIGHEVLHCLYGDYHQ